ncbi:unnamed protein product [Oppiella nova]|uniref:Uncharacterized protein n=1 Tax=Oppiella nova TaxID=334625 RepID=A0A7R9ME04_9ACAR|nr:unnamed protein product [Oppiella nova]CAG2175638.1 unnamed protein product [Oppiella nova]
MDSRIRQNIRHF